MYIDENARVYQDWDSYITNNTLPKCVIVVPENGEYTGTLIEVRLFLLSASYYKLFLFLFSSVCVCVSLVAVETHQKHIFYTESKNDNEILSTVMN